MKVCLTCKVEKEDTEFNKGTNGAKLLPHCKPCSSKRQAEKYRKDWFTHYCRTKKSESKKKGIAFELTPEYLKEIYTNDCPIYNLPFVRHDKTHSNCPTLDRVDPKLGYVKGNVVFISARANRIKYDSTPEELDLISGWMKEKLSETKTH